MLIQHYYNFWTRNTILQWVWNDDHIYQVIGQKI